MGRVETYLNRVRAMIFPDSVRIDLERVNIGVDALPQKQTSVILLRSQINRAAEGLAHLLKTFPLYFWRFGFVRLALYCQGKYQEKPPAHRTLEGILGSGLLIISACAIESPRGREITYVV